MPVCLIQRSDPGGVITRHVSPGSGTIRLATLGAAPHSAGWQHIEQTAQYVGSHAPDAVRPEVVEVDEMVRASAPPDLAVVDCRLCQRLQRRLDHLGDLAWIRRQHGQAVAQPADVRLYVLVSDLREEGGHRPQQSHALRVLSQLSALHSNILLYS